MLDPWLTIGRAELPPSLELRRTGQLSLVWLLPPFISLQGPAALQERIHQARGVLDDFGNKRSSLPLFTKNWHRLVNTLCLERT